MHNSSINITGLSHSKMHIGHRYIISLMPKWTATTWEWLLRRSRSFKVTDFGINQKLMRLPTSD